MRLFRSPFEQFNLYFPVALLGFALIEYTSGDRSLWRYADFLKYIQDIIFFNGLHVCLTFVFIATTAAGRETYQLFLKQMGALGVFRIAVVFWGSVAIYYYVHTEFMSGSIGQAAFYLGLAALRRKHDLGQSKGLLRIANRNFAAQDAAKSDSKFANFDFIQKAEHYLINVFYFTSLTVVITYFNYGIDLGAYGKLAYQISITASLLIAGALSICALLSPQGTRWWKFLYSARFYLKTFGPFSALAAYGGAAVHGTEYLFVTDKVISSERKQNRFYISSSVFMGTIAIVFFSFAAIRYPEFFFPSMNKNHSTGLTAFAAGIILTHFFVDYLIFTPKNDFARPLLKALSAPVPKAEAKV
jgi:hypothetical protein